MKTGLLIVTVVLINLNHLFCQVTETKVTGILFHGLVVDASSLSPVANSQIIINKSFTSVSNIDGTFAFYVNSRDTVIFKSLGYKPAILVISDTLQGKEFMAGVYLNTDTLLIDEVIIVPRLSNLKSDILNSGSNTPVQMENARYNVAVSAYHGRNSQSTLGDPAYNYEFIRQRQKIDAFEKGGIPSDRIAGINPLLLIPVAYLLIHGLPENPPPMQSRLTDQEVRQIHQKYLETVKRK